MCPALGLILRMEKIDKGETRILSNQELSRISTFAKLLD
jgi:hypothetical protein